MGERPLFTGELVELRPVDRAYLGTYVRWMRDPDVTRYLNLHAVPMPLEKEEQWYERVSTEDGVYLFGIHLLEDGTLIGNASLESLDERNRSAILGIVLGEKDHWGKGYGTDAVRELCRLGFSELNLHRIELDVFAFNERGIRAYEKAGFTVEGRRREALFREGRYHDRLVMAILSHEWPG